MRTIDIISEATGPKEISTGKGKIKNPAYMDSFVYEGDPAGFNFGAQRKNYEVLKNALARNGLKFDYIGVAKSGAGPDVFVATAPNIVWYKYVGNNPQSGQNNIWISGVKIQTSTFTTAPNEEQDEMISGSESPVQSIDLILTRQNDIAKYIKTLTNKKISNDDIIKSINKNKITIFQKMVRDSLYASNKSIQHLENNLNIIRDPLKDRGLHFDWMDTDYILNPGCINMISESIPMVAKSYDQREGASNTCRAISKYENLVTLFPRLQSIVSKILNSKKETILSFLKLNSDFAHTKDRYGSNDFFVIIGKLRDLDIDWKELDTLIFNSRSKIIEKLTKLIRHDDIQYATHFVHQVLESKDQFLKNDVIKCMNEYKDRFISHLNTLKSIETIVSFISQMAGFGIRWPELSEYFSKNKDSMISIILRDMANNNIERAVKNLDLLIKMNLNWPELDVIKQSIESDKSS